MSTERRHPNVVNRDEVPPRDTQQAKHQLKTRTFGPLAGNVQLGGTLTEIPPGAISYPFHYHCANEEAIYVIAGTGTTRIGDARVAIRAGDWIAYPPGPAHAHQIINDGTEPLVYLAISTGHGADVVGYPDSNKVAFYARPAGGSPWHRQIVRPGETLDYWEDEPGAK